MRNLIISYHSILKRHGLAWLVEENKTVAVYHVLSSIRFVPLITRLTSDLDFAQHSLRKAFNGFMKHPIKWLKHSNYSTTLSIDPKTPMVIRKVVEITESQIRITRTRTRTVTTTRITNRNRKSQKKPPLCLQPSCRENIIHHYMKDGMETTPEEQNALIKAFSEEKANTGPSKSTRGQTLYKEDSKEDSKSKGKTTGQLDKRTLQKYSFIYHKHYGL